MRTLVLSILFFLAITSFAQTNASEIINDSKFRIGIKGMYQRSKGGIDRNYVFNYGIPIIYKIGKKWSSIEMGIYSYKRTNFMSFNLNINDEVFKNYELNNLHIPIKYRYARKFIYFTFGAYGEYLLTRNIEQPPNTIILGLPKNSKFTWGYISSIGVEKMIVKNKVNLFTELEISNNLSPLYWSEPFWQSYSAFSSCNYGIGFGINYKL